MKKLLSIAIIIALGLVAGLAIAGNTLTFTDIASVTNSAANDFGVSSPDYWCEITDRAGNNDIVVTIQGTNLTTDSAWTDMVTDKTIANSVDSSWQFQSFDYMASRIRLHVVSGADITNTVSGVCGPGGR